MIDFNGIFFRGGNTDNFKSSVDSYIFFDDVVYEENASTGGGGPQPNTPPTVSFQNPSQNVTLSSDVNQFEVAVNATDSDGSIQNVKLYVDNQLLREEINAPYEWGHTGAPNPNELISLFQPGKTYTLKAEAIDNDGAKASTTINVTMNAENQSTLLHDAYLQTGVGYNTTDLRVESGASRISYMIFDLSDVEGVVQEATLELAVGADAGQGEVHIYQGLSSNWEENNLSNNNRPEKGNLLATKNESYNIGETYTWNLNGITMTDKLCLIVEQISGNDVSFWSKEGSVAPILIYNEDDTVLNVNSVVADSTNNIIMYPNPAKRYILLEFITF